MDKQIPKVIHYCWFGGKPLPELAKKCIESWRKYLPGYKIKRWDETNFDINCIPYVKEAYEAGKYAFVSDFARFKILYENGGIYFDTDVQVIKPLDDIINAGSFMGREDRPEHESSQTRVNPGIGIGCYPGHPLIKELIDSYADKHFKNPDGSFNYTTIVTYTREVLLKYGLTKSEGIQKVGDFNIYPWDYFCPMTPTLVLTLTPNSRSIHLYDASWCSGWVKFRKKVKRIMGHRLIAVLQPIIQFCRNPHIK